MWDWLKDQGARVGDAIGGLRDFVPGVDEILDGASNVKDAIGGLIRNRQNVGSAAGAAAHAEMTAATMDQGDMIRTGLIAFAAYKLLLK